MTLSSIGFATTAERAKQKSNSVSAQFPQRNGAVISPSYGSPHLSQKGAVMNRTFDQQSPPTYPCGASARSLRQIWQPGGKTKFNAASHTELRVFSIAWLAVARESAGAMQAPAAQASRRAACRCPKTIARRLSRNA